MPIIILKSVYTVLLRSEKQDSRLFCTWGIVDYENKTIILNLDIIKYGINPKVGIISMLIRAFLYESTSSFLPNEYDDFIDWLSLSFSNIIEVNDELISAILDGAERFEKNGVN